MSIKISSQMTKRFQRTTEVMMPVLALTGVLTFLGLPPSIALFAGTTWVAVGLLGGSIICAFVGEVEVRLRLPLALGPGTLLGIGLIVFAYLGVRGGWLGFALVLAFLGAGTMLWLQLSQSASAGGLNNHTTLLLVLISGALIANSKEFPNLLVPGFGGLLASYTWSLPRNTLWRGGSLMIAAGTLIYDVIVRPSYWWWSSDDTTTLSGIGTIIVERGRVADTAGWSTGSHHWLLHAWLALWNQLSFGQIFETYLIAWPIVAATSLFASLWLCIQLYVGRDISPIVHLSVALVTAGLVRLEWPAPQEQQPFVFAMIASAALWLNKARSPQSSDVWRLIGGIALVFGVVPAVLFVLKPSLLIAHLLIVIGAGLVRMGATHGKRLVFALAASIGTISTGIGLMSFGGAWVSQRSFTTLDIDWFPNDLGWCRYASRMGSLACVLSLQVKLFVGALLAGGTLWMLRAKASLRVSPVVLLPLVIAYLPLRYFVSSGVGSGAPSFYRLSEIALMLFIALGVAVTLSQDDTRLRLVPLLFVLALLTTWLSEGPSRAYDSVDRFLVGFPPLRYLNASDVMAITLAIAVALVLAKLRLFSGSSARYAITSLVLVSMLPVGRMVFTSATSENDATRLSRPADFGPQDIEHVGQWLRENTSFGTLLATNYLCPNQRLDECTREKPEKACPQHEPSLMASWALTALSRREFLYLSQGWDSNTLYYFIHRTSTRLGSELSPSAVSELESLGVSYYVASRPHSNPRVWSQLLSSAEFSTNNFAVVPLAKLASVASS